MRLSNYVFCLLEGQGHAADGEVGGGDGPQTCHGGVSDWDRHKRTHTRAHTHTHTYICRKKNTPPQIALYNPETLALPTSFSLYFSVRTQTHSSPPHHSASATLSHPLTLYHWAIGANHCLTGGLTTYREGKCYLGDEATQSQTHPPPPLYVDLNFLSPSMFSASYGQHKLQLLVDTLTCTHTAHAQTREVDIRSLFDSFWFCFLFF